jgi:hypothetical protein
MSIHFPKWCKTRAEKSVWASHVATVGWAKRRNPEPRVELPDLVRRITLEDFVTGQKQVFDLNRCVRIDQYRVTVNGRLWRDQAGLSVILAGLRKAWGRYRRF